MQNIHNRLNKNVVKDIAIAISFNYVLFNLFIKITSVGIKIMIAAKPSNRIGKTNGIITKLTNEGKGNKALATNSAPPASIVSADFPKPLNGVS